MELISFYIKSVLFFCIDYDHCHIFVSISGMLVFMLGIGLVLSGQFRIDLVVFSSTLLVLSVCLGFWLKVVCENMSKTIAVVPCWGSLLFFVLLVASQQFLNRPGCLLTLHWLPLLLFPLWWYTILIGTFTVSKCLQIIIHLVLVLGLLLTQCLFHWGRGLDPFCMWSNGRLEICLLFPLSWKLAYQKLLSSWLMVCCMKITESFLILVFCIIKLHNDLKEIIIQFFRHYLVHSLDTLFHFQYSRWILTLHWSDVSWVTKSGWQV